MYSMYTSTYVVDVHLLCSRLVDCDQHTDTITDMESEKKCTNFSLCVKQSAINSTQYSIVANTKPCK